MRSKLAGVGFGVAVGFTMAWARLTDPEVIRSMLLLREFDVFFLMGSAVFVAAVGVRVLRSRGARALVNGELVAWTVERPQTRHVVGSLLFGAGWSVAGTCPGPVAAMIGEGRLGGLVVAAGLVGGVALKSAIARSRSSDSVAVVSDVPGAAGL